MGGRRAVSAKRNGETVYTMKKTIVIILLTLALTSCAVSDKSAYDMMLTLDPQNGYLYISDTDISSVNYISSERLGYLYYGEKTEIEEINYTESYCIYIGKNISPSEIHIFKAKYQSDVDKLKRMLQSRADILSKPQINPNDSNFLAETGIKCQVYAEGRFVFLVAGDM